jgi:hypothetical protein
MKCNLHSFIIAIFIFSLTLPLYTSVNLSVGAIDENYTYYGIVPSKIYRYYLKNWDDRNSGWIIGNTSIRIGAPFLNGTAVAIKSMIAIVAAENNTNVEVRDLSDNSLLSSAHLSSMEKHLVLLDNGTTFKVVSDKQVSVLLLNYQQIPPTNVLEGPTPYTFYTSSDGLYVGKEFVLMASEGTGADYTILAIEKSTVTVTKDDGDIQQYSLDANSYKKNNLMLSPFRVYKIESTGNIMVQSGAIDANGGGGYTACFPVPSAQGGFVGTFFLTKSLTAEGGQGWDSRRDYGYRIEAVEDAKVKVFDLETKQVLNDITVKGGSGTAVGPSANAIAVQSDKPITLSLIHNGSIEMTRPLTAGVGGTLSGYGNGVMFISIQPNKNTMIYLPVDAYVETHFFAKEETQLTIDDVIQTIHADSDFLYTQPGIHKVQSNKNVVLQIDFWPNEPDYQGLWYTGATIPSIETVNVNPTVTITPLGEGLPMMYVIIGAGAAAVAVIVGLLVMRRRSGKPS